MGDEVRKESMRDIALELLDLYLGDEEQLDSEFYHVPQDKARARRKREKYEWLNRIRKAEEREWNTN